MAIEGRLALFLTTVWISDVNPLTIAEAKATLDSIARDVVRSKTPVIVRTRYGFIQIAPHEGWGKRAAKNTGRLSLLPRELELHNTLGESV